MNIKFYIKNYRFILGVLVIFLFVMIFVSKLLRFPQEIGLCYKDLLCESFWLDGVALPLYSSLPYLIISILILVLFSYSFLKIWMKIMIPFSLIALVLVVQTPDLCGGMICFDRTLVATGFSKLFLIFTIIIILSKSIYLLYLSYKSKKLNIK